MLALLAIVVLAPLLYIPGYLIAHALLGTAQPPDLLERHYERVVAGALLNGWLALTLAELGVFSPVSHLLLAAGVCIACAAVAWRRGALRMPQARLGIVAWRLQSRPSPPPLRWRPLSSRSGRGVGGEGLPADFATAITGPKWAALGFVAVGLIFVLLVARPFEVVLGARDAGVYANSGFAIARTGGIVQHDTLVRQLGQDQKSGDPTLRDAAAQAETNFLGNQAASRFIATRLRVSGFQIWSGDLDEGRVVPQFLHLYPAWIGLLAGLIGLRGGLLATSLLGFLGVWSVGMLGRRLAGPWVGLLGALFLALNGVQVWFSRYSTSEACAQFLCFAALYGFAVMQGPTNDERRTTNDERRTTAATEGSAAAEGSPYRRFLNSRSGFVGLLAGLAAGQLALTRIDFFVLVAPLLLYLAYMAFTKRWSVALWALSGGLGAMLLQALLHIVFISRAYFLDTLYARLQDQSAIVAYLVYYLWTPALRQQFMEIPRSAPLRNPLRLPIELALVALAVAAFLWLRRIGRPQRWFEQLILRYRHGLLRVGAMIILLLGVYGYFIRPQILTTRTMAALPGCLAPAQLRAPTGTCLALQGYIGAPIDPPEHPNRVAYVLASLPKWLQGKSTPPPEAASFSLGNPGESEKIGIAQANLVRLGWYLSPLGLVLGMAGFALWWRRGMSRASWLFLLASVISAFFFIRLTYGTTDLTYIYILRRYVPMVYPAFSLGMAYAIVALARRPTTDDRRPTKGRQGDKETRRQGDKETANNGPRTTGHEHLRWSLVIGRWSLVVSAAMTLALVGFFLLTNRSLYAHVEYEGALAQISAIVERYGFGPRDVLLFRGEGRDTPDLVVTPLKYAYNLDALAIRSADPGKYAEQLAGYVRHWQAQGRQLYLVLGPNGAVDLPGLRPARVGPMSLRLPEFQQLRAQKPGGVQEFVFDFVVYRLAPAPDVAPQAPLTIAVDDYTAQVQGFYHPEQIAGMTIAWTDGSALLRLPWPGDGAAHTLTINLSPGATRPAALGPAQVCVSYRPEMTYELANLPFSSEQCATLDRAAMAGYRFTLDARGQPAPKTGTFLLRIVSKPWVPAKSDAAQIDQRSLGVQFGGLEIRD